MQLGRTLRALRQRRTLPCRANSTGRTQRSATLCGKAGLACYPPAAARRAAAEAGRAHARPHGLQRPTRRRIARICCASRGGASPHFRKEPRLARQVAQLSPRGGGGGGRGGAARNRVVQRPAEGGLVRPGVQRRARDARERPDHAHSHHVGASSGDWTSRDRRFFLGRGCLRRECGAAADLDLALDSLASRPGLSGAPAEPVLGLAGWWRGGGGAVCRVRSA